MEEREEVESSEKDKPYLTKMITPPLACGSSGERMPDWGVNEITGRRVQVSGKRKIS